jgi:hypothetical protein
LQGSVGKQKFFRSAAALLNLQQVKISKDAVQDKRDGEHHDVVAGQIWR